jgi:hypothetical protein
MIAENVFLPLPGDEGTPVRIRPRDDFLQDVTLTAGFIGSHSYKEDIAALLKEVDTSEQQIKSLKVNIVEKENFIESLAKREDIVQADLNADKMAVNDLTRYISSI